MHLLLWVGYYIGIGLRGWRRSEGWNIFLVDDLGLIGVDRVGNSFGWFWLGNWC